MREADGALVWPRERSEPVGDFRHFEVVRDWVRSPESEELRDFYVLDMPDWVQVLALTPHGQFVMVEQFRHGTRRVTIEFTAGLVEPGETPAECAVRELEEETGYVGGRVEVLGEVDPNAALQRNRLFLVLIRDCRPTGTKDEDPGEVVRPCVVEPNEVDAMLENGDFRDAYGILAWDFYRRWERKQKEADADR